MMSDSAPPELPETSDAPPPTERVPFWGYHDLLVFVGLFVVSLIAGFAAVTGILKLFRVQVQNDLLRLLPAQFVAYLFLFLAVSLLFRTQYNRPFWSSMAWTNLRMRPVAIIAYGVLLAFAIGLTARLLHTPDAPTPMSKMLSDRTSVILVALFGATLGPLCEEIIFRGFLQ